MCFWNDNLSLTLMCRESYIKELALDNLLAAAESEMERWGAGGGEREDIRHCADSKKFLLEVDSSCFTHKLVSSSLLARAPPCITLYSFLSQGALADVHKILLQTLDFAVFLSFFTDENSSKHFLASIFFRTERREQESFSTWNEIRVQQERRKTGREMMMKN